MGTKAERQAEPVIWAQPTIEIKHGGDVERRLGRSKVALIRVNQHRWWKQPAVLYQRCAVLPNTIALE